MNRNSEKFKFDQSEQKELKFLYLDWTNKSNERYSAQEVNFRTQLSRSIDGVCATLILILLIRDIVLCCENDQLSETPRFLSRIGVLFVCKGVSVGLFEKVHTYTIYEMRSFCANVTKLKTMIPS